MVVTTLRVIPKALIAHKVVLTLILDRLYNISFLANPIDVVRLLLAIYCIPPDILFFLSPRSQERIKLAINWRRLLNSYISLFDNRKVLSASLFQFSLRGNLGSWRGTLVLYVFDRCRLLHEGVEFRLFHLEVVLRKDIKE